MIHTTYLQLGEVAMELGSLEAQEAKYYSHPVGQSLGLKEHQRVVPECAVAQGWEGGREGGREGERKGGEEKEERREGYREEREREREGGRERERGRESEWSLQQATHLYNHQPLTTPLAASQSNPHRSQWPLCLPPAWLSLAQTPVASCPLCPCSDPQTAAQGG